MKEYSCSGSVTVEGLNGSVLVINRCCFNRGCAVAIQQSFVASSSGASTKGLWGTITVEITSGSALFVGKRQSASPRRRSSLRARLRLARERKRRNKIGENCQTRIANCVLAIKDDSRLFGCDSPKRDRVPLRFGIQLRQPRSHCDLNYESKSSQSRRRSYS